MHSARKKGKRATEQPYNEVELLYLSMSTL